jgi:diguanylate cyclase (GGDEF)-like protein
VAVRNYTPSDGLPQAQVTAVRQDPAGYLWIGTRAGGVGRYDGHEWVTTDASSGLPGSRVNCLEVADDGDLFVGTSGGVARFRKGKWDTLPPAEGHGQPWVTAMLRSGTGRLWIGSETGLSVWDAAHRKTEIVPAERPALANVEIDSLAGDGKGGLWVGTALGLAHIPDEDKPVLRALEGGPRGPVIALLARIGWPLLLAVGERGVFKYDGSYRRLGDERAPGTKVTCLAAEADPSSVWIGTDDRGAFHYRNGAMESFGPSEGLINPHVYAILDDREGTVWLGTDGGLAKRGSSAFITWDASDGFPQDQPVYGMAESGDHNLWFSLWGGGLLRISPKGARHRFTMRDGLPDLRVNDVGADSAGGVWIATRRGLAHTAGDKVVAVKLPPEVPENIRTLCPLPEGGVLLGTFTAGMIRWDGHSAQRVAGPLGSSVGTITIGRDGTIWCGGDGWGVVGLKSSRQPSVLTTAQGLPSNQVHSILEDSQGRLWVATDRGAWRRDPDGKAVVFDRRTGLPDSFIYWVGEDHEGTIWLGTNHGVVRLDAAGEIHTYTSRDGLGDDECNEQSFLVDSSGKIYVGNLGVSLYQGAQKTVRPVDPPVYISHVLVGGREMPLSGQLSLPYSAGPISFDYVSPSFTDENAVRFRYRLAALSSAWNATAPGQFETTYGGLGPGKYVFEVFAVAGDGRLSRSPAVVAFTIQPVWWRSRPAGALAVVLVILAVLGFVNRREHRLQERQRQLESLIAERTEELRRSHDMLTAQAVTDELTRLPNRRHIVQNLEEAIAFARRQGIPLSIAMADLDRFKRVNDVLGHAEGDRVLRLAGLAMRQPLRTEDVLGRYGGEEFLAILPGSDGSGATAAAERMREAVAQITFEGSEVVFPEGRRLTVSIGIAVLDERVKDSSDLIRNADAALYRAKAAGRDRVVTYRRGDSEQIPVI